MKIYHINPEKSKIKWSSQIGEDQITGEVNVREGVLINELGQVIEGNIAIDLSSLRVTDSTLDKEHQLKLEEQRQSLPLLQKGESLAEYKIKTVIHGESDSLVKGLLIISDQAFGIDVSAKFESHETELKVTGQVEVKNSNPVLLQELEHLYNSQIDDDTTINNFNLECDLIASAN